MKKEICICLTELKKEWLYCPTCGVQTGNKQQ